MHRIKCTNHEARLFKECQSQNVTGLTIKVFYPIDDEYPRYNCFTDTSNDRCKFFDANFDIIMYQEVADKIQPAYQGMNKCYRPKIQFPRDLSINRCYFHFNKILKILNSYSE